MAQKNKQGSHRLPVDVGSKPQIKIVYWNCRSLANKRADLANFTEQQNKPEIICLQETRLKKNSKLKFIDYIEHRQEADQNSPGLSILTRQGINLRPIENKTGPFLNTQVVEIYASKTQFFLTNAYLRVNPQGHISASDLRTLLDRKNHILVGDLNAHSPTWGNHKTDWAGRILEEEALDLGSIIYNTGAPTRLAANQQQKDTAIDLTILSNDFTYPTIDWEVTQDTMGSDHWPCITTLIGLTTDSNEDMPPLRFNTKKADWTKYRKILEIGEPLVMENINAHCNSVIERIKNAALKTIPNNQKDKRKNDGRKNNRPTRKYWWDDNCKRAVAERTAALKEYTKKKDEKSREEYRKKRNRATAIIIKTQKQAWRDFVNNIDIRENPQKAWKQINAIRGKNSSRKNNNPIEDKTNNTVAITDEEKAELLAQSFAYISSDENLDQDFRKIKEKFNVTEKHIYTAKEDSTGDTNYYNLPLTMKELQTALDSKKIQHQERTQYLMN